MLFASHNGSTSPVYDSTGPQLVGNRLTPTLVGTQRAALVGAPSVTLVGATASTAGAPNGPIPLQPPGRAPIDASGRVAGTYSAMDRARAILERTAVHRSADQLVMRPWQGGQLGSAGIDPTKLAPGAYAAATRTGVVGWGVMSPQAPMWWRPDATYKTSVLEPSAIRTTNPVEAARQVINPFIGSARPIAPGIANWPGQHPVYRSYQPATVLAPSYPGAGTSPTSTPCPSCTYSPMVATQRVGTVPAATPQPAPAASPSRSAFGFWRA